MADRPLADRRILVVEDEYLLADEVTQELRRQGAIIIGPAPDVRSALALLDTEAAPDAALLDVNLSGEPVFAVADALIGRGIPVVFSTGYDAGTYPNRFAHIPRCEKPINMQQISAVLGRMFRT